MCALGGMVGACARLAPVVVGPQDQIIDQIWLGLQRGDAAAVRSGIELLDPGEFAERARWDLMALEQGRAAALVRSLEQGSWLSTRYRASREQALADLQAASDAESLGPVAWLELARRSASGTRRRSVASRVLAEQPGGAEALAVTGESWLAERRLDELQVLLEPDEDRSARLRWLGRRSDAASGRLHAVVSGLTDDLEAGLAVPEGLQLLGRLVTALPDEQSERRLVRALAADRGQGARWRRARDDLAGRLAERRGEVSLAIAGMDASRPLGADDVGRRRRLLGRLGADPTGPTPELRVDADAARLGAPELKRLRLAREWSLAARQSYQDVSADGALSLDEFVAALDSAAAPLGEVPSLAALPRRSFGLFGEMLDTAPLRERLPGAFIIGGKGLGMAPELTWYDLMSRERVPDERAADEAYDLCLVRSLRVPGQAAAAGARFTGAGLVDVVFLDLDELARTALLDQSLRQLPELGPLPAQDRLQRRSLSEPLDQAQRLTLLAVEDAAGAYEQHLLQSLSLHEAQHIADAGRFLERNIFGKLSDLIGAGLLPGNVRAELERRAQLAALQGADDPRIPLADMLAMIPLEGALASSEHARGYAELLGQLIAVLDGERWEGAVPLEQLGLSRQHVLVQQLHLLDKSTLRALAVALPLD
ncbi:MAG: hypothetical protein DRQ55_00395 [Planctomycetota bacterium]|nr:MAG: hypothetical protein DRQ55_00395 [Planctomycetota bacterium]